MGRDYVYPASGREVFSKSVYGLDDVPFEFIQKYSNAVHTYNDLYAPLMKNHENVISRKGCQKAWLPKKLNYICFV